MLCLLKDASLWKYNGTRYVNRIVFTGYLLCVCPGKVSQWYKEIERFFKEKAYTSELDIDWSYYYIAERKNNFICRGIHVEMDTWLFQKCFNPELLD